jgi:hypothetical protein
LQYLLQMSQVDTRAKAALCCFRHRHGNISLGGQFYSPEVIVMAIALLRTPLNPFDLKTVLLVRATKAGQAVLPGLYPHVLVLDAHGKALYNQSGEVGSEPIENIFEKAIGH